MPQNNKVDSNKAENNYPNEDVHSRNCRKLKNKECAPRGNMSIEPAQNSSNCCGKVSQLFKRLGTSEVWKGIIAGQFLAGLLCGTGVTSQYLSSDFKIDMPTAQSFANYALLCLVFTTWLACRPGENNLLSIIKSRGWKYILISAADVEANYLLVKAYQYTTLTSVQLLDCFTIPVVLTLSFIFLKVRYKIVHILGVGICLLGVGCLVWADIEDSHATGSGSNKLLGDMLCLSGAVLYGISNVSQEYTVKTFDHIEFLGMIGLFGSIINGIQLAVFERKQVAMIKWNQWQVVACIIGYVASLFTLYVCMPLVMKLSSATAVVLSLLTADFYSLIFGIYLFKYKFHVLYFASFSLIILGVIIFFMKPTNSRSDQNVADNSTDYRQIPSSISGSDSTRDCQPLTYTQVPGTSRSNTYNSLTSRTTTCIDIDSNVDHHNNTSNAQSSCMQPGYNSQEDILKINGTIGSDPNRQWSRL